MRRIDELHLDYPFAGPSVSVSFGRRQRNAGQSDAARPATGQGRGDRAGACRPDDAAQGRRRDLASAQYVRIRPGHKIYPYLLRNLTIDRPSQVWAMDITYIPMARGFVYLAAVVWRFVHGT